MDGEKIDTDWCKGYSEGADCITELNKNTIAEGTEEKVAEVEQGIKDGTIHVFDTSKFTVDGSSLEDLMKTIRNMQIMFLMDIIMNQKQHQLHHLILKLTE